MIDEKDWKIVQKVQKVIFGWKNLHVELNDAINYFKDKNQEAYKISSEISKVENNLVEKANKEFAPLLSNLKKTLSK